jgi:hypothetical protein
MTSSNAVSRSARSLVSNCSSSWWTVQCLAMRGFSFMMSSSSPIVVPLCGFYSSCFVNPNAWSLMSSARIAGPRIANSAAKR